MTPATVALMLHFGLGGATGLSVAPAWEKQGIITDSARGALAGILVEALWHKAGFSPTKWEYDNKHLAGSAVGGALGGQVYNGFLRPQRERNTAIGLPGDSPIVDSLASSRMGLYK